MSTGFTVMGDEHLIRANLWSTQLKELLLDDLCAMKFVKLIEQFPDGTTINIPSIGEAEIADYAEGQAIKYSKLDTGNFTFSFDKYQYSAHSISEKFKRDSFYADEVIAAFLPRQHRALMEAVETRIFERFNSGQTGSNANQINGADHRWVGSGDSESLALTDFAKAHYALTKANVPLRNLVAIVDPSVAYTIQTQANVVNLISPHQQWENMVNTGLVTGMNFRFNIYGFDVYVSNYLPRDLTDSIGGRATSAGVANLFFSAAPGDTLPIIGGFRQMPTVHSEFNKDLQQTEYLTIAEYGFKVYRPENCVVVVTDTDVVA
jgi:hypothetical protein